jgi:hypothetical protein
MQAYEQQNFFEALNIWRPLSDVRDAKAAYIIGALYLERKGV